MNLKLVFRIFAGFGALFAVMGLVAPESMADSYGMAFSDDIHLVFQFAIMIQIMMVVIVWQLPEWLGDNLAKAGTTMIVVSLLPVAMNIYHVVTDALPASTAQLVESGIWVVFAALFYFYSKKS
ncbi:MAG: hypothetical protein U9N31_01675 [Candidatus Marinimicrobia bacterium]|nr:hypothetical protein [Candidatus Neomarinimicrobiota bacterium]